VVPCVLGSGEEFEVGEVVVEPVAVSMVDDVSGRNRSVGLLPDVPVLPLVDSSPGVIPSEEPVPGLGISVDVPQASSCVPTGPVAEAGELAPGSVGLDGRSARLAVEAMGYGSLSGDDDHAVIVPVNDPAMTTPSTPGSNISSLRTTLAGQRPSCSCAS
jgi:hypothetical protein